MAISPALAMYLFLPGAELAKFIALVFAIYSLFKYGSKGYSRETFKLFLAVIVITVISYFYHTMIHASWFNSSHVVSNILSSAFTFAPIVLLSSYINPKLFIKAGIYLGIIASLFVIWQRFMGILTGSFPTDFFLPWFEINRDIETFSKDRPSAFFTEPAHFCIFLLPVVYTTLLYKNFLLSAFFSFAILCSGSTTGFLMIVILLVIHIIENKSSHKWRNILLLLFGSGVLYYLLMVFFPQIILENLDKVEGVQEGNSDMRLLGPLDYFWIFDEFEQFFGITLNQLEDFGKARLNLYEMKNFSNGALFMLLSYGFIGFFFLLLFIIRLWKRCPSTKGYLAVFMGILCSDQILFNCHFMYLVLVVLCSEQFYTYINSVHSNK